MSRAQAFQVRQEKKQTSYPATPATSGCCMTTTASQRGRLMHCSTSRHLPVASMIRSAAEEPYLPVAGLAASCVVAPDLDIP